jgi:MerR family transcriptional regulator/heat shock protein HspR
MLAMLAVLALRYLARERGLVMVNPGWADLDRGLFSISVAAELAGLHLQTLRIYEREGLLDPARSAGGTRRYSRRDIDRLAEICALTADGLNQAGIRRVLALQEETRQLQAELPSWPGCGNWPASSPRRRPLKLALVPPAARSRRTGRVSCPARRARRAVRAGGRSGRTRRPGHLPGPGSAARRPGCDPGRTAP